MMKTNLLRCLLILFLVVCVKLLRAQLPLPPQPVYIHYNSYNSGLPTDLIFRMIADKKGYIWLATDRGLMLYNGKVFKPFTTKGAEDFVSVFQTSKNMLWLFAQSGRTVGIDLNTQRAFCTDSAYGLAHLDVPVKPYLTGFEDNDTIFLAKQAFKHMVIIDPRKRKGQVEKTTPFTFSRWLLQRYHIPSKVHGVDVGATLDSVLIRRNSNGLSVQDSFVIIDNMIFRTQPNGPATLCFDGYDYGIRDGIMSFTRWDGDLYLGALGGIGFCKIAGFFTMPRSKQQLVSLLPGETVTTVMQDYQHNIWVSTYGNGLFLFPRAEAATLHYNKLNSGLYEDDIKLIREFPGGITAVGYNNARLDMFTDSGKNRRYTIPAKQFKRSVVHLERMANHWLLFSQTEAFCSDLEKDGVFPDMFRASPVRKRNFVVPGYKSGRMLNNMFYYASSNNGIISVDTHGLLSAYPNTNTTHVKKRALLPVSESGFYIGTVRGMYYNNSQLPYLQDAQINSLDTVSQMLLMATSAGAYALPLSSADNGKGLRMLTPSPCYTIKHDHALTYLQGTDEMIILRNGDFSTTARFPFKNYAIPFRLNDFYSDSLYLILAGNRGLFYIPRSRIGFMGVTPQVHLRCSLSGYSPSDSIYEGQYRSDFSALLEIDILDYSNQEREISYRLLKNGAEIYRQKGLQDGGQVNFQPSGPGSYRVEFKVRWPGGRQRLVAYNLELAPLWYQQWWCLPLLLLLSLLAFAWSIRWWYTYHSKKEQRKLEQKLYLQELESQSLFGQLKPHFIFNILTPLQGYFIREDKINGLNYLNNFSSLMRGILNGIRDKYSTLQHEIDFIAQYLSIQQERFGYCFRYNINIAPSITAGLYVIPTLLLQPVVENAIEHGIDKNGTSGQIDIDVSETDTTLVITVTDNGRGLPPDFALKENHALKIITERMSLLEKMQGTGRFTIAANTGLKPGTTATFILAKEHKAPAIS
ncbi:sensor histidine kinase [Taibaiella koreensis]|uniref:sensor histidine kinase n=1 Tax=Taibaiella koreensis TaxID=1268548 RepID=UPI000E59E04A|nr:histidine kinase [Taibaiella koreensis]